MRTFFSFFGLLGNLKITSPKRREKGRDKAMTHSKP